MGKKITGADYPLMKIFSSDFDYHIPAYQRPYAWTEEEAGTLFDDLYDFYRTEQDDSYFLGSIVLIKEENDPHADVIDGQQRLTTLTILLSALTSHFSNEIRTDYNGYLREPGRASQKLPPRPRLHLRQKDQDFFEKYIQNVQLDKLVKIQPESLSNEAQQHIQANCKIILEKIKATFNNNVDDIMNFGSFLVQRCYIVAVYTPNKSSAFRVFSVMNSRGLDLMPIDIIKADIVGKIPESERDAYTEKWEDLEEQTTRSGFNEVFAHTRMIFAKTKAKRSLIEEFKDYVIDKTTPKDLVDTILEPYSEAYTTLKNKNYMAAQKATEVNNYLQWLNKIDNSDWMPTAIEFFSIHKDDQEYILWFIKQLERLAAYLHITEKGLNQRIERYCLILREMEKNPKSTLSKPLMTIQLSDEEKSEFIQALDSEIYIKTPRRRSYIVLRLDSFVSDGAASYNPNILTIEHVLPQTVKKGSEWDKTWPNINERKKWLNRIANLIPLTRRHNSEAQNYDFDVKKRSYFSGKNGTTSYALATQVINESTWTPTVVSNRQNILLKVFKEHWEL